MFVFCCGWEGGEEKVMMKIWFLYLILSLLKLEINYVNKQGI